ncbi:Maf family protein [Mycetocola zhujimingii]|uniref:Nucleoside triphosphate pyrophosphatase n=1 Tax=Mycetocola zhujimingii TaxID=2079792 RepID=A0A2U1TF42_9MICO|nr:nucleoside triphosphate pyrophosphatase [Mycetocola zhujimingii]PWC07486.1 septum formation inhibitor Maf [Mycetocola zhujimingii]
MDEHAPHTRASVTHPETAGVAVQLYLASTSPARLMLLRQSGIEPVIVPSDVDEDAAVAVASKRGALSPEDTVLLLAKAKAEAVAAVNPEFDGLILGGDSVFVVDDVIYGKPHTPEVALERWRNQRGATGRLYSGHWLIEQRPGAEPRGVGAVAHADVTFASDITDGELEAYIATGEPLFVAGAFTIDSLGAAFIDRISGDPSTVVGLSLPTLRRLVRELGHDWTSLWNRDGAL